MSEEGHGLSSADRLPARTSLLHSAGATQSSRAFRLGVSRACWGAPLGAARLRLGFGLPGSICAAFNAGRLLGCRPSPAQNTIQCAFKLLPPVRRDVRRQRPLFGRHALNSLRLRLAAPVKHAALSLVLPPTFSQASESVSFGVDAVPALQLRARSALCDPRCPADHAILCCFR